MISTEKNILMCSTYIPPTVSMYFNDDSFSIQEREINNFQGHVLVCGDQHARTGQEPDTLAHRGTNTYLEVTAFLPPYAPLDTTMTT